jgi:hypothetical protein
MKHPALFTHGLVAGVCAVVVIGFAYNAYFLSPTKAAICDRNESEIGENGQGSVLMVDGECDGMASSSSITLSMKDAHGKISPPFLVYYRSGPDPAVTWTAPNTLLIDMADPETIQYARDEMNGIKIRYRMHWTYNDRPAPGEGK